MSRTLFTLCLAALSVGAYAQVDDMKLRGPLGFHTEVETEAPSPVGRGTGARIAVAIREQIEAGAVTSLATQDRWLDDEFSDDPIEDVKQPVPEPISLVVLSAGVLLALWRKR